MLWLFGGANATGSAANPVFNGSALARRGVVVVTANYRLGVMGFMAHPELSRESEHGSSGNHALLDQIMALRWIRKSIAAFGDDPGRVTLFGQSSGSYDLLLLMTSPLARGLFVGAITHLRALPAQVVAETATRWLRTDLGKDMGLLTNVDGWLLPDLSARVFTASRQAEVPLILGNSAREITPQVRLEELRRQIRQRDGDLEPRALAACGLADGGEGWHDPLLGGPGSQWMTDIVQGCAAGLQAHWHADAGHPTWQYEFDRNTPRREADGDFHGAEVAFVFGTLGAAASNAAAFTAADQMASSQIQEYWTRFAQAGDPNGAGLPEWPRAGGGRYLAFTADGPVVKERLQEGPCRIFHEWTLRGLAAGP